MDIGRWHDWLLRMESDRFIMIVHKETNEYVNIYKDDFRNPNQIKHMALLLNRHENYK